jgi:tRNA-modifying protein YgfZ
MSPDRFYSDRSARAKLRFTGPQRAWFLHQVLSQSFEDIAPGQAREAAMLTPHGRMIAYLEAVATEDSLLAHFEPELRTELTEALGRYVFATRVEIEDVTEEMGLVLVAGEGWEEAAQSLNATSHPTRSLGIAAAYLWVPSPDVGRVEERLQGLGFRRATEEQLEAIRIANGVPRWGREMTPKTLPQEAGIDEFAVHYDKGCYLGQEAMAKIHFRGRVNRRLRRLRVGGPLHPGDEVTSEGRSVGRVTSASSRDALAILRREVERDAVVHAGAIEATVVD